MGRQPGEVTLSVAGTLTTGNTALRSEYEEVGWSRDLVAGHRDIQVPVRTLDSILEGGSVAAGFDVLVVDVEGFEAEVAGFDLDRWSPRMLIVELVETHPDLSATREADAQLLARLEGAGYDIVYKDMINTVLVKNVR